MNAGENKPTGRVRLLKKVILVKLTELIFQRIKLGISRSFKTKEALR